MSITPWSLMRDLRYAMPKHLGHLSLGPDANAAAKIAKRLRQSDSYVTFGYFPTSKDNADSICQANLAMISHLSDLSVQSYLSIKAPMMRFDWRRLHSIAAAANAQHRTVLLDSHSPEDASKTLELVAALQADFPQTGCVLPARWQRSLADADRFASSAGRIRIVKGEWTDVSIREVEIDKCYLALVERLAGRNAPVAIATHDPELAHAALSKLVASGTPCELEQLRGLPCRRLLSIAQQMHVPVRIYLPFGDGWWPYAVDKALARPYLPFWYLKDRLARSVSV
jgi:proline dehydrogenase